MSEKEKKIKHSSDELFSKWLFGLYDMGVERYRHSKRHDIIEDLGYLFLDNDVDYEEAKTYKNRTMLALTTEEGRKGKGQYKGWKEACFTDFDEVMADMYIPDVSENREPDYHSSPKSDAESCSGQYIMPEDEQIKFWAKKKFGDNLTEELLRDAHTVGSALNLLFIRETLWYR